MSRGCWCFMLCGLAQDFSAATEKIMSCSTLFARKASGYVNKGIVARIEEGCSSFLFLEIEISIVYMKMTFFVSLFCLKDSYE